MKHDFKELKLDRVTRRFAHAGGRAVAALDGLSITIPRGEFVALLGPSGCGKSTALNCIAGLLALSDGSIHLDDMRIDVLPPEARGFGMVFQNYALFPHMSVRRNIGFGLRMRGVGDAEAARRVDAALKLVQLAGHADKLPGQLSGGQQQRVAIARAIVVEPPLVLMDEPLSNLDAKLRLEMRSEIRRIHRNLGRSTIYVTHDQDEALSLADRIVVMKDGTARQVAAPAEVYANPADLDVARFMGYRNELALTVKRRDGERVVVEGEGLTLTGIAKGELAPGTRARAMLRPDDIVVADAGAAVPNAIDGVVDAIEYGGRESLIDVVTQGGARLHVRSAAPAQVGAPLRVGIPESRLLVYREAAA
ncbi:MAG TPA: ABC transporter ATP-binding protein [Casimicrobiaceae bacterium]|jgi:putative spermidine/putrescine transport system ATP-binding protein|nr:ABC transporter ATP-binding protein [Casimicrobiaceae bacterium]